MKTIELNSGMRIKDMACVYHAITNVYGDIPVDVYISYDGNISISPSKSYGDVIDERILLVRDVHGEHTDTFSLYTYDDDYDEVIYDEKNSFYELSLLEACGLIMDVKDYFDYNIA